jgi:hypothetical protein
MAAAAAVARSDGVVDLTEVTSDEEDTVAVLMPILSEPAWLSRARCVVAPLALRDAVSGDS